MPSFRVFVISLLCLAVISGASCASKSSQPPISQQQLATVKRADVRVDFTASGNLALSDKEDLPFGMAGFVEYVAVKEGDAVTAGQVMANLNASDDWEAQVTTLERSLTAAQKRVITAARSVASARRNITTAERNLADNAKQSEASVAAKKTALLSAEISAMNAEIALAKANGTYRSPYIEGLMADMQGAEIDIRYDNANVSAASGANLLKWSNTLSRDISRLDSLRSKLKAILTMADEDEIAAKTKQLDIARINLKNAQDAVPQAEEESRRSSEAVQLALEDAHTALDDAESSLADAQIAVVDAQKNLDKARVSNPVVTAPFSGFVTAVKVKGGDEVKKGTVAVQIADPKRFEANVTVGEKDYYKVKTGGEATVQVNADSALVIPAVIAYVSPTATAQSGSATYKVRIELEAPKTEIRLSEGMGVIVNILVEQRKNAIVVPNQVVVTQARQATVTVIANDVTEVRNVRTGLSDWQYTEVLEGLTEGEQVVYPVTTSGPASTSTRVPNPGNLVR